MEHLIYVFMVFALGFLIGWREREKWATKRVDALMDHFNKEVEKEIEENRMDIKIEKHNDIYYVFNKHTDDFMAQAATRKELEEALAARFSGKRFFADAENLKEVGLK